MRKFLYVVLVLARFKWISIFRDLPDSTDGAGMLPAPIRISALILGSCPRPYTRWLASSGAELPNERIRAGPTQGLFEIF